MNLYNNSFGNVYAQTAKKTTPASISNSIRIDEDEKEVFVSESNGDTREQDFKDNNNGVTYNRQTEEIPSEPVPEEIIVEEEYFKHDSGDTSNYIKINNDANGAEDNDETDTHIVTEEITEEEAWQYIFADDEKIADNDNHVADDNSASIEGMPYSREYQGNPRTKTKKVMSEMTFGTEAVAEMLGTTSQTIRNYVGDYNEFLGVKILPNGRREFKMSQVEKLRKIMEIKDSKGYTTAKMIQFLKNPGSEEKVASSEEQLEEMFGKLQLAMQQSIVESMRTLAGELMENNYKMLEMKDDINNKVVDELKEQVREQGTAISELLELVKSQANDENKKGDTLQIIENLQKTIEQRDEKIEELTAVVTKQKEEYDYLKKTSRKKFLGFL